MGSGSIADFSFALIVGIGVGTYSSLFIATPVFLWVNKRFYGGKGHLQWRNQSEAGVERPVLAPEGGEVDETGRTEAERQQAERAAAGEGEAAEGEAERERSSSIRTPSRPTTAATTAPCRRHRDDVAGDRSDGPRAPADARAA
jgi:preprotein translocase subunit SecF